jgi:metallo-beta-lactamase family protein
MADLDGVVLTHAHLDHSGYLPVLAASGYRKPVWCTELTADLCHILLPDAARIQEFDAEHANKGGYSRHNPSEPLFTEKDARRALKLLAPCLMNTDIEPVPGATLRFRPAGHIPGASTVDLEIDGKRIVFSGDLGRYNSPMFPPPEPVERADFLVLESTYGDSVHSPEDPEAVLEAVINRTVARGGSVIIPSFAVGRAQLLLYHVSRLYKASRIPPVPLYLDSPMAIEATELVCHKNTGSQLSLQETRDMCDAARLVADAWESERIVADPSPKIVLSASGMATGGRVLSYLKRYAPDPRNTILFAGYQAGGTRGAHMVAGAKEVKIHGAWHAVRAEVLNLDMLSAHADSDEIMQWLSGFRAPPARTFIVHGEPGASDTLRQRIEETLGWSCHVPEHEERVDLGNAG